MDTNTTQYKTCADVRFRVIAGEGVIIRQEIGEALVVNEVGASILKLLNEGVSTSKLIERIAQEFDVEEERLTLDVHRYLSELESANVVEKVA